jgi:DNA primase
MPKTKFVDFKAIKAAVTMEQVLQHYSLLDRMKRSGDSLSGCCPIHQGTNPTQFRVSVSKNIWNCFSECKHGGNVLDFVARMENISAHGAALRLIEWFNLEVEAPPEEPEPEAERPRPSAKTRPASRPNPASPLAPEPNAPNKPLGFQLKDLDGEHLYLAKRELTLETITEFSLGYCAKGTMAGHIAIPIHNAEGKLVAYAGRWPGEPAEDTPKYKLPAGFRKSQEFFNLHRAIRESADSPLLIVEGFFDVMKLWQLGVKRVVALMGSSLSAAQEELLRRHTNARSQIILLLDEDEAGRAGRDDIAARLAKFCFVKAHQFDKPGTQPENLSAEDLAEILEGLP